MVACGTTRSSALVGKSSLPCWDRIIPSARRVRARRCATCAAGEPTTARFVGEPLAAGRPASVSFAGANSTAAGAICPRGTSRDEVLVHGTCESAAADAQDPEGGAEVFAPEGRKLDLRQCRLRTTGVLTTCSSPGCAPQFQARSGHASVFFSISGVFVFGANRGTHLRGGENREEVLSSSWPRI
jgi:hypothetical protein